MKPRRTQPVGLVPYHPPGSTRTSLPARRQQRVARLPRAGGWGRAGKALARLGGPEAAGIALQRGKTCRYSPQVKALNLLVRIFSLLLPTIRLLTVVKPDATGSRTRKCSCAPTSCPPASPARRAVCAHRRLGRHLCADPSPRRRLRKADPVGEIRRITGSRGVDVAIEARGTQATEAALRVLRPRGTPSSSESIPRI